jgi:hypothetical protein
LRRHLQAPFAPSALKGGHLRPQQPVQRRTARVPIRYAATELETVRERARNCGLPVARFVREASLGAIPRARRLPFADELIHHLARIGNNLNQMAFVANATDRLPTQKALDAVLDELRTALLRITTAETDKR